MRERIFIAAYVGLALAAIAVGTAVSQPYPGPPGGAVDQQHFGQFVQTIVPTPGYSNLTVTPANGLYVTVAPVAGGLGGVVQQSNPLSPPSFGIVGVRSSALAPTGPLAANTVDLVECQVSGGDVFCKGKNGTYGIFVAPAVDAGWVAVATVSVPAGTTLITSGMIAMRPPISFSFTATVAGRGACTLNLVYDLGADPNGVIDHHLRAPGNLPRQRRPHDPNWNRWSGLHRRGLRRHDHQRNEPHEQRVRLVPDRSEQTTDAAHPGFVPQHANGKLTNQRRVVYGLHRQLHRTSRTSV
jgi:hypothetical protein